MHVAQAMPTKKDQSIVMAVCSDVRIFARPWVVDDRNILNKDSFSGIAFKYYKIFIKLKLVIKLLLILFKIRESL